MNVIAVVNTKGGVGKTTLATQFLPLFSKDNESVSVFELDNNNLTNIPNSKAITFKNLKTNKTGDLISDITMDELLGDNNLKIIDCGGGDDTKVVLSSFKKYDIKGIKYIIPINDDIEQTKNMLDTIELIRENDKESKIYVLLNRCNNLNEEDIANQFIAIFGSEKYGIKPLKKLDIEGFLYVPTTPLFGILKSIYGTTIKDVIPEAIKLTKDAEKTRIKFLEDAKAQAKKEKRENDKEYIKKVFSENMAWYAFAKDILELEKTLKTYNGL